jgi:hypothetical protein
MTALNNAATKPIEAHLVSGTLDQARSTSRQVAHDRSPRELAGGRVPVLRDRRRHAA